MQTHRVNELINLLHSAWLKESELNLVEFLKKLGDEAGHCGELDDLSDEILIYHLKLRNSDKTTVIPGIQKDYEEDFKSALLKARGINKE